MEGPTSDQLPLLIYFANTERIEGWLQDTTAHVIRELLQHQLQEGVTGDVMEIGVHHGRLFILLCLLARPSEKAIAVDLFDMQELNVDKSGLGNLDQLRANLKTFAQDTNVEFVKGDSIQLAESLKQRFRSLRYISIDGGHTREATCNDLWIAESILIPEGVVSLDDIYSLHWSGVTAGLAKYFAEGGSLIPFCLSPEKVHFARTRQAADKYKELMSGRFDAISYVQFFNEDDVPVIVASEKWNFDNWVASSFPKAKPRDIISRLPWVPMHWTASWFNDHKFTLGRMDGSRLLLQGESEACYLWGPYVNLGPGEYSVEIECEVRGRASMTMEVVHFPSNRCFARRALDQGSDARLAFSLAEAVEGLEVRLLSNGTCDALVRGMTLEKISQEHVSWDGKG